MKQTLHSGAAATLSALKERCLRIIDPSCVVKMPHQMERSEPVDTAGRLKRLACIQCGHLEEFKGVSGKDQLKGPVVFQALCRQVRQQLGKGLVLSKSSRRLPSFA